MSAAPLDFLPPSTWSNLVFTEAGQGRLAEIVRFLQGLYDQGQPRAAEVEAEFRDRMQYLDEFGGQVSEQDPRRRFRVTLGRDWAPMSFTITWAQWTPSIEDYAFSMSGALIWHGGSNDPLCVSLTPQLWGIHS